MRDPGMQKYRREKTLFLWSGYFFMQNSNCCSAPGFVFFWFNLMNNKKV